MRTGIVRTGMAYLVYRRARLSLLILTSLLLAGCGLDNFFGGSQVPLELDYNRLLPEGWQPITRWYEVSIDNDADIEYLLLFTYDSGQVGAVIYDQQVSTDLVGSGAPARTAQNEPALPLQAFGYYRPYLLLPSNWNYTYGGEVSHGFIAHPQDADNVVVTPVARGAGNLADALGLGASAEAGDIVHPAAELVILGGTTHLTLVWWKNRQEGYGVTQLYAPGGFRGINWRTWRDTPTPIDRISGLDPLWDYRARSLLCRETVYQRRGIDASVESDAAGGVEQAPPQPEGATGEAAPVNPQTPPAGGLSSDVLPSDVLPSVAFADQDLGIRFCTGTIPSHPFYPEGVALAFLLQAGGEFADTTERGGAALLTDGVTSSMIDGVLNPGQLSGERVNDIQAFATVPVTPDALQDGVFSPTTSVCLELARLDNPEQRRWLLFTLRYHAPDMEARTPDRWTISGVTEQPRPIAAGAAENGPGDPRAYCRVILGISDNPDQ